MTPEMDLYSDLSARVSLGFTPGPLSMLMYGKKRSFMGKLEHYDLKYGIESAFLAGLGQNEAHKERKNLFF